jgi:hypothetical protein
MKPKIIRRDQWQFAVVCNLSLKLMNTWHILAMEDDKDDLDLIAGPYLTEEEATADINNVVEQFFYKGHSNVSEIN